ncbi:DUF6235 family protein [Actinophytocola glycyrrhizae]|uniref:DUF6235 family protein n=1 Tax=Actinophytocola glycyrrhizae TaxID=2044873 RepID=A0ABV9RY04_9PSEU
MSDNFQNQSEDATRTRCQLQSGWDVLTEWSDTASPTRRNAVYGALFSMLDRTLFRTHQIVDDPRQPAEFFVAVRDDLVLKLRVNALDSFEVLYVGTWENAPGFEFGRV